MSQSLAKNLIHLVYSTKNRNAWIAQDIRESLYTYQAGIFRRLKSPVLKTCAVDDHIHGLFSLSKNYALKTVVEEVKKGSSKWMKAQGVRFKKFCWQKGYAGFSVSQSNVDEVIGYIENQDQHHRRRSFQDELRLLLDLHDIEYDERYIWD